MHRRSGFTLIELMISLIISSFIVIFIYQALAGVKKGGEAFARYDAVNAYETDIRTIITQDMLYASELNITEGREFDLISLRSYHSLYNLPKPYIQYLVLREDNRLLRIEGALPFNYAKEPPLEEVRLLLKPLVLGEKLESFKVYRGKKNTQLLLFIAPEKKEPILLELYAPAS